MLIIPQIETPVSENYAIFEENLINLLSIIEKLDLTGQNQDLHIPRLIIEQNFGVNGLLVCKDLKDRCGSVKTAYAFNMRDKNRISILSDLITLKQLGINDIIVSEGIHPLKTAFNAAKPVYDIDVLSLGLILKRKLMKGSIAETTIGESFGAFNFGVVSAASTAADGLKIKKLADIGADRFILNYTGKTLDEGIINYIKSEKREIFLYVIESHISNSLEDIIKESEKLNLNGVIIKIIDEKSNIFTRRI
jgi:hypothetical protein